MNPHPPSTHPFVTELIGLLNCPAPSGREDRIRAYIQSRLEAIGVQHTVDAAGNVVCRFDGDACSKPDQPLVVYASHMDEIGMVVTDIHSDGTLEIRRSGMLFPYKLGEAPIDIVGDHDIITGVVAMGSSHTGNAEERVVRWQDVKAITGLTVEALAAAGVRPGSTAVPVRSHRGPHLFGDPNDPMIAAWTLDDRGGVATLLRLLQRIEDGDVKPARPTMVAFTVQEEGGCYGAKVLAQRERPEVFIAVDGCPMPPDTNLTLEGGPCIWSKDMKIHFDQALIRDFLAVAKAGGIPCQTTVYERAFSDASAVFDCGAAPRVATVGHVRENSHGYEVARLSAFDQLLELLARFMSSWDA